MFQLQLYRQETIKNYYNFLAKDLKDQFTGMNIKQKVRIKMRQMNINIFSNQILLESTDYLFLFIQIKITILAYLNSKTLLTKR